MLAGDAVVAKHRTLSLCSPLSLVGRSFIGRQYLKQMSSPVLCWDHTQTGVFGYVLFSVGQESLWSSAGPIRAACTLPGHHFGSNLAKDALEGTDLEKIGGQGVHVSKVWIGLLWEGIWSQSLDGEYTSSIEHGPGACCWQTR